MYSMGKNKSSQDLASMSGAGGAGDAGDVAGGSGSGSESGTDADVDSFSTKPRKLPALSAQRLAVAMREAAEGFHGPAQGIGIDAEDSKTFQGASETFLDRNFTTAERRYAEDSPDPAHALAGRWAAKEAVIKALSSLQEEGAQNLWIDASAPLKDIEVIRTTGAPFVRLWGHAKKVSEILGVTEIKVSISHAGSMALAQCMCSRS